MIYGRTFVKIKSLSMIQSFTFVALLCLALLVSESLPGQINQASTTSDSIKSSPSYTPSRRTNKIRPQNLIFSGAALKYAKGRKLVYLPPLTNTLSANTVEGVVLDFRPSYTNKLPEGKFYYLKPSIRYGFSRSSLDVSGGRYIKQLNEQSALAQNIYTSYTLLNEDNYLKIYEKTYLKLSNTSTLFKNLLLTGTLSWNERAPLENLPEYADGEFTSNAPENLELDNTAFSRHQLTLLSLSLSWQANAKYTHKRGRFITEGELETGDFISSEQLTFVDFNHFNGNQTIFNNAQRLGDFQLLDYYTYSTRSAYLKAHYEHRWKGITSN